MLLIVDPVTFVLGTVSVSIFSEAVSLVIFPLAIIDVAIRMNQSSTAISFIGFPISFINATIAPNLISSAVSKSGFHIPFSLILSAVGQHHHLPLLFLYTRLIIFVVISTVFELRQVFPYGLHSCSLLFKFFRVHFNVNSSSHK